MTPINEADLRRHCASHRYVGRSIRVVSQTGSTNDLCRQAASAGADEGLAVFAEHQTAGRGRLGRRWTAPPHSSLLFSLLLQPPPPLDRPEYLTAWSAVAVVEQLRSELALNCRIKWPNDILANGRKLCGILVERSGSVTVVGIGLNVLIGPRDFPASLRDCATSLLIETGTAPDRTGLAVRLLRHLEHWYAASIADGPEALWERWQQLSEDLTGVDVVAQARETEVLGRLLELRPDRGARVVRSDGTVACIPPEQLLQVRAMSQETIDSRLGQEERDS